MTACEDRLATAILLVLQKSGVHQLVDRTKIPLFTFFFFIQSQVVGNGISEPSTVSWIYPISVVTCIKTHGPPTGILKKIIVFDEDFRYLLQKHLKIQVLEVLMESAACSNVAVYACVVYPDTETWKSHINLKYEINIIYIHEYHEMISLWLPWEEMIVITL